MENLTSTIHVTLLVLFNHKLNTNTKLKPFSLKCQPFFLWFLQLNLKISIIQIITLRTDKSYESIGAIEGCSFIVFTKNSQSKDDYIVSSFKTVVIKIQRTRYMYNPSYMQKVKSQNKLNSEENSRRKVPNQMAN